MKELKIFMKPKICKKIYDVVDSKKVEKERLKEIIMSNIRWHLIKICHPSVDSLKELDELKSNFENYVEESPNNWKEESNWITPHGIFFKILINEKQYNPLVNFLEMEIEEVE